MRKNIPDVPRGEISCLSRLCALLRSFALRTGNKQQCWEPVHFHSVSPL
ncbi:hypothetical protein WCP94_002409 [Bilophila wadsworthia]